MPEDILKDAITDSVRAALHAEARTEGGLQEDYFDVTDVTVHPLDDGATVDVTLNRDVHRRFIVTVTETT